MHYARSIFIVGCGRSGSTLLGRICSQHPSVSVAGEANFLYLIDTAWQLVNREGRNPQDVISAIYKMHPDALHWGLSKTELDPLLEKSFSTKQPDHLNLLKTMHQKFSLRNNTPIVIDRTHNLGQEAKSVTAKFPNVKFIHMVRDGRYVAASHVRLGWYGDYYEALANWEQRVCRTITALDELTQSQVITIRYEDLVNAPFQTMGQLFNFLELDFEPQYLTNSSITDKFVQPTNPTLTHPTLSEFPSPEHSLTSLSKEQGDIPTTAFDLLESLGYQVGDNRVNDERYDKLLRNWDEVRRKRRVDSQARLAQL